VIAVCLDEERRSFADTRQEHDLEEIRLLFARYRRAVREVRTPFDDVTTDAEAERETERVPAGAGV
jgi:hypothetical protein